MFKAARWRSEKNKVKAVFKFQFHATQVPELGWEAMVVSLVPADVGRPTLKSEKGEVVNGVCHWGKPIWETVKFIQDTKSGKINEKAYQFLVSDAGSTKARYLGETTINLADYADVFKPSSVSLPLKGSNTAAILHVTIQRMQGDEERRVTDGNGAVVVGYQHETLQSQLSNEKDEIGKLASDEDVINSPKQESLSIDSRAEKKFQSSRHMVCHADFKKSNGSNVISRSCSDSSSGQCSPKLNEVLNSNSRQDSITLLSPLCNSGTPPTAIASSIEWSATSAPDGKMDGSTNSSGETGLRKRLYDPDISLEKLRSDAITLARQLDLSELELQTLRKQVVKESKRGQDHLREISSLKEERDTLQREFKELKNMQKRTINSNESQKMCFDGEDLSSMLEEIKQELSHEKNLNANLQLQLQKTQESNSELILAVRDLDELLEHKNREISSVGDAKVGLSREIYENYQDNDINSPHLKSCKHNQEFLGTMVQQDDEEQYALEVLVKEHDVGVKHSLEQEVISLKSEVDLYRKDREELEMQMEQLALDYEILKQENHEISSKLEQIQLREQLRMQYECSAHLSIINDLESHIEGLEKNLEDQVEAFEADLETITRAKVEQEQRAIRAEEALRDSRRSNANTAEKLQEDFKRLSAQMSSTFYANEKLAMKAMTEANDLRLEKFNLEELLWKLNEELILVKDQYHVKLQQLSNLLDMKTKETNKLLQEVESKSAAFNNQRKYNEALQKAFLEELLALKGDIEKLEKERLHHSELVLHREKLVDKMEKLKSALEDGEMTGHNRNTDGGLLEQEIVSIMEETNKSLELKDSSHLGDEEEMMINNQNSEVKVLKVRPADLGYPSPEDQIAKDNSGKEVFYLTGELQNGESMDGYIKKKLEDSNTRIGVFDGATKTIMEKKNVKSGSPPNNIKEVGALQEKCRFLEQEIKLKDAKLEDTKKSFLEKEDIHDAGSQEKMRCCEGMHDKAEDVNIDGKHVNTINNSEVKRMGGDLLLPRLGDKAFMLSPSTFNRLLYMSITKDGSEREESFVAGTCDQGYIAEILSEVAILKEHNKAMEAELKEMQQRYSAISLKFAEVEGERQQLVMTVRGLKNGSKI